MNYLRNIPNGHLPGYVEILNEFVIGVLSF